MRDREQVIRDFVQQWLAKANADLQAAEVLISAETHDYFTCAFHCQQAAEKYLKAYLVRHQVEFRKTHDLNQLVRLASEIDAALEEELTSAVWLTPFGVEFRYPGDYPDVDLATAQRAVSEANLVKQVITDRLSSYADEDSEQDE